MFLDTQKWEVLSRKRGFFGHVVALRKCNNLYYKLYVCICVYVYIQYVYVCMGVDTAVKAKHTNSFAFEQILT